MASLDGVVSVQQSSPGVPGYTFGYNWGWPSPGIPASMQYAQKFQKAYGYPPDAIDMKTYEAVRIIAAAIEQAKSLSTDDIVKALEKIDYQGITGRIRFDRSHDPIWGEQYWTGVLVQWLPDGSAIVIYPPRIKTGNPILPIPNS
jgi:branched-chain amino acid transport system substrate-binding protein